ncbi:hypothetical protein CEXT_30361 [Caerostris extrusa]|uniref:Uncharacterized protein n=1 Tax=Caerostris extrusa TaxID=172846 RepID=A0AAV4QNJ4_CAEEX|nr:hypothetical protein CEXT_30361 [Caerostris extrusa]
MGIYQNEMGFLRELISFRTPPTPTQLASARAPSRGGRQSVKLKGADPSLCASSDKLYNDVVSKGCFERERNNERAGIAMNFDTFWFLEDHEYIEHDISKVKC